MGEKKSNIVKITEASGQYRLTYPKKLAYALGIKGGTFLSHQIRGGELVLVKTDQKNGMSNVVKVAESKYQIRFCLLRQIAHALGMKRGDHIEFKFHMGEIILRKVI